MISISRRCLSAYHIAATTLSLAAFEAVVDHGGAGTPVIVCECHVLIALSTSSDAIPNKYQLEFYTSIQLTGSRILSANSQIL